MALFGVGIFVLSIQGVGKIVVTFERVWMLETKNALPHRENGTMFAFGLDRFALVIQRKGEIVPALQCGGMFWTEDHVLGSEHLAQDSLGADRVPDIVQGVGEAIVDASPLKQIARSIGVAGGGFEMGEGLCVSPTFGGTPSGPFKRTDHLCGVDRLGISRLLGGGEGEAFSLKIVFAGEGSVGAQEQRLGSVFLHGGNLLLKLAAKLGGVFLPTFREFGDEFFLTGGLIGATAGLTHGGEAIEILFEDFAKLDFDVERRLRERLRRAGVFRLLRKPRRRLGPKRFELWEHLEDANLQLFIVGDGVVKLAGLANTVTVGALLDDGAFFFGR